MIFILNYLIYKLKSVY